MKKMLFLASAILLCGVASAQSSTVKRLFKEAKAADGARILHPKPADFQVMDFYILGNLQGGRLTDMEKIVFESPDSVKEQINRAIRDLNDPSYETLFSFGEDGAQIRCLGDKALWNKLENKELWSTKRQEVVLLISGEDPVIMRIKGLLNRDYVLGFATRMKQ